MLKESAIMLCFNNTRAAPCFWLCYSNHLAYSWRSWMRRLEKFVSLCCTSDLPMMCERNRCMTEVYFWCFFFFWTVFSLPNKICILASSVCIHNFMIRRRSTEEWWSNLKIRALGQSFKISKPCLYGMNQQTGCGRTPLQDRQTSLHIDSHVLH